MKNYKRLFFLLKGKRQYFYLGMILVILIQVLNFLSPLLVKNVLDDCILGIEYDWVEIATKSDRCVTFNDHFYKQVRYLEVEDEIISEASLEIKKEGFFFTIDNEITTHLSKEQVLDFYTPIIPDLYFYILLLFGRMLLVIIFNFLKTKTVHISVNYIANRGRTIAVDKIEYLPIHYFEEEPAGKMANRITRDVDGFITMYNQLMNLFASAAFSFILAYVGMFMLNAKLALLSFIIYPVIFIWISYFLTKLRSIAEKVNESRSMLSAKINEVINGIQILQIFNFKKQTVKEFNEINEEYMNEQLKDVRLGITLGWNLINVVKASVTAIVVVYFGLQNLTVQGIVITAGLIYAYNEYLGKLVEPINIVFTQISNFEHSFVQADRISKIIEAEQESKEKTDINRYNGNIKFDNVWFSYVQNEYVLKGVSFDIKENELVGIVGHTGSGKSTLMNLLLRFYDINDPLSGKIYVDGVCIDTFPKRTYRKHIGIVLQEPIMITGTIADNIRFGKENVTDEKLLEVLTSLGGDKILKKFPNGIHQNLSKNGINLSAGEKQIISLARAIVHDSSILIMDEATSHIDIETESMIKKAIQVACKNRTVIVIAHRLSTIFNADKIIVLDHGLKVEEGNHEELIKKNGTYANIYRSQVANTTKLVNNR